MRAITPFGLRYLMVKIDDDDVPSIFGYDAVDTSVPFYVVEGPIDSLFLRNSMACNGTSFGKLEQLDIPKDNCVVVVDNQPRNTEVADITRKYLSLIHI